MAKIRASAIALEFVTGGVSAVEALFKAEGDTPSRDTVRSALKKLKERGQDYQELDQWFRKQLGFGLDNRRSGPTSPRNGTQKIYVAQGGKYGGCYMKVPLGTLGVKKGASVRSTFVEGRIIIEAA